MHGQLNLVFLYNLAHKFILPPVWANPTAPLMLATLKGCISFGGFDVFILCCSMRVTKYVLHDLEKC